MGAGQSSSIVTSVSRSNARGPGALFALLTTLLLAATFALPSLASAYITTHAGPIETNPHVYEIFWGSNWNQEPAAAERGRLQAMYGEISGSAWQGILTQYWSPTGFISPTITSTSYTDSVHGAAPQNVTNATAETEVNEAIAANVFNGWPQGPTVNDQFVLFAAPGTTYNPPNPEWCGKHEATSARIVYALVDWGGGRCSMNVTAAHEYAEAVTDPYPNPLPSPFEQKEAWNQWPNEKDSEIADICGHFGRGFLPGGTEVPSIYDNSAEQCSTSHSNPPQIAPQVTTGTATGVTTSKATLNGTFKPNRLVADTAYFRWHEALNSGSKEQECPNLAGNDSSHNVWSWGQNEGAIAAAQLSGLNPGKTYCYQAVVQAPETHVVQLGPVREFTTVGPPRVTSGAVSNIHAANATISGTVNPNGSVAKYFAEYVTEKSYLEHGYQNATSTPVPGLELPAGSSPVAVSVPVSGLAPEGKYEMRLAATTEAGTAAGETIFFQTLQTKASTEVATRVGATDATLNATINPEGIATSYKFEYGRFKLEQSIPVSPESVGAGIEGVAVSQTISGLQPNSNYEFEVVAENAAGKVIKTGGRGFRTGACKGTEGRCEWKTKPTPDLTSAEYSLSGVSCASSSMCFAVGSDSLVGKGLGELWNGSEWSTQAMLSAGKFGYSNSVSCPLTTWCMAVGNLEGGGQRAWKLKEEGGKWASPLNETPPTPSGGAQGTLRSVSCTSTTACTAVGTYYAEAEKATKLLVEGWNGTSWTVQTAPALSESTAIEEVGVSCASSSFCMMAGTYLKGTTAVSFAQRWNGTKWVNAASQNPGAWATGLDGVSCPTATSCVAIGGYKEIKGQAEKPLAESWNGTEWSVGSVPSPTEAIGGANLRGISCISTTACTAIGSYRNEAGQSRTLAESWDGSKWTIQSSPNSSTTANLLNQVSCTSSSACTAVGSADPTAGVVEGELVSLAERWSGTEWKAQPTPNLATSQFSLSEVSCASSSMCFAVGGDPMIERGLGELWDGSQWTLQVKNFASKQGYPEGVSCPTATWCVAVANLEETTAKVRAWRLINEGGRTWNSPSYETLPLPAGGSVPYLASVSCSATSACTATGSYYDEEAKRRKVLVERWDGSSWTTQTAPSPELFSSDAAQSVSCSTATSCTTVGTVSNAPFAERWDGANWSVITPALQPNSTSGFGSVSCGQLGVTTTCIAVGSFRETGKGQYDKPLAERWNGSSWSILSPLIPSEAKGDVDLKSVSCTSPISCTAAGSYSLVASSESSETRTFAESWDGSKWTLQSTPNSAQKLNALLGISCSSSNACSAVGSAQPGLGAEGQVSLAERFE